MCSCFVYFDVGYLIKFFIFIKMRMFIESKALDNMRTHLVSRHDGINVHRRQGRINRHHCREKNYKSIVEVLKSFTIHYESILNTVSLLIHNLGISQCT